MFLSVLKFIGICIEVLLIFNLLIFVHELGHFLAAKWRGLYVQEFALWFGKPLWRKKIGGVWYAINSIPAGGYVKLPQMAPMDAIEGDSDIPRDQLKDIKPLDKIIVAFAGPLFSFLIAIVFAVVVWQVGKPVGEMEKTTTVGFVVPGDPAEKAGLQAGDIITAIDSIPVTRWVGQGDDAVTWRIARSEGDTIRLDIERASKKLTLEATPKTDATKWYQRRGLRQLGIGAAHHPMVAEVLAGSAAQKAGFRPSDILVAVGGEPIYDDSTLDLWAKAHPGQPLVITLENDSAKRDVTLELRGILVGANSVFPGGPAARAGVKGGDRILSADGEAVSSREQFITIINAHDAKPVALSIERGAEKVALSVTPEVPLEGSDKPSIGIGFDTGNGITFDQYGKMDPVYPGVGEQVGLAVTSIVNTVGAVTSRKSSISVQHMGGPVMMMRIYYLLFESPQGWRLVLWFSVLLNVNLAMLNMLPIPILDGGHILLAIVEAIRRKPMNVKVLEYVSTACVLVVMGFMAFVTFFDIQDVFGGGGGKKHPTMRFKPQPAPAVQSAE